MPLFRTRLFEDSPNQSPLPPYRSRTWTASLRGLTVVATDEVSATKAAQKKFHFGSICASKEIDGGKLSVSFSPEIVIDANSKEAAQIAANLIAASKCLLDGDFSAGEFLEVARDINDAEFDPITDGGITAILTHGYARAAAIAAKIATSSRLTYAVSKYWLSLKTHSVASIEHHPRYGSQFTVERDPFYHASAAAAIIAAYSVLEEIGVAVKATQNQPSKNSDGTWNPLVLDILERSLAEWGINANDEFFWLIRTPETRIERRYPIPTGQKASWARSHVRDRKIAITDAIHYCGRLRSRVSAHATGTLTKSLNMYHVINSQHLARQLLLQALGEWRRQ